MIILILLTFQVDGQIQVEISGIDFKKGGLVNVGLFEENEFLEKGKEIQGRIEKVSSETVVLIFDNVPSGTYAIAAFQDVDKDGELSSNLFGIPNEPYGFSQNKFGRFGPPNFEIVSFELQDGKSLSLNIELK